MAVHTTARARAVLANTLLLSLSITRTHSHTHTTYINKEERKRIRIPTVPAQRYNHHRSEGEETAQTNQTYTKDTHGQTDRKTE